MICTYQYMDMQNTVGRSPQLCIDIHIHYYTVMDEREQNTPFTNNFIYLIMLTNELEKCKQKYWHISKCIL